MTRQNPPGWTRTAIARHGLVAGLSIALVLTFHLAIDGGFGRALWNRSLGRAAVVLLAATLLFGPLARLVPRLGAWLPLRREMGAWSAVLSLGHVVFVMQEWAGWELSPLWKRFIGDRFVLDGGLALANLVGVLAAGYALVLLVTSNDAAQRRLGRRWTWIQRGATTFLLLAALHTAYFLYLGTSQYHPGRGLFSPEAFHGFGRFFLALVGLVVLLRAAAFWLPSAGRKGRG